MADFKSEDLGTILVLTLSKEQHEIPHIIPQLHVELDKMISSFTGGAVIVDFKGYSHFGPDLARMAAQCGRLAQRKKQKFFLAALSTPADKFLKSSGVDDLVTLTDSLSEAKNKINVSLKRVSLDVSFVNPFITGALETLKVQCNFVPEPGAPLLRKKEDKGLVLDIIALIGLTSKAFTGTVALCFPGPVFLKIMSGMLGEECKELNQDIEDGAGELLNIIFGQAKIKLNEKGHEIEKAIPSVIRGSDLNLKHLSDTYIFVLPFKCDAGQFEIQIAADPRSL